LADTGEPPFWVHIQVGGGLGGGGEKQRKGVCAVEGVGEKGKE